MKNKRFITLALAFTGLMLVVPLYCLAAETPSESAEAYYDKGIEYGVQGKFKEAREEFEKALEADRSYGPAKEGLRLTEDAISRNIKKETALYVFKGAAYVNKGMLDEAIAEFGKAIAVEPRYALAYNSRGGAYDNKGEYDRAIADYDRAIEINPRYAGAYLNRGSAYDEKGEYDRAIADYDRAIGINPRHAEAYVNRGYAYYNKGEYDRAIADYDTAIAINPRFAMAYNNRGYAYLVGLGNKSKGCSDWKRACELGRCGNYNLAKSKGYCE